MATEAPQPVHTAAHDAPQPQPQPEQAAETAQKPPVKRSWRRKYRKMRIRFDDAMSQSNHLIMDEWKAMGTARRLQAENDQLLEALLDFNSQPRVSARQRFDLADPASTSATTTTTTTEPSQHLQSLAALEATVPHTSLADLSTLPDGIDLSEHAPGYMSPAHEEEYLLALDQLLDDPAFDPANPDTRTLHLGPSQPPLSEKELTIRNPDSVYSWLRKNQPQVFLQDKDAPHHDNVSEKAAPKAASKKARQSNMGGGGGTPGPKDDHDGDDSAVPETKAKGKKSGGDPDDTAYRPKGGSSRPAKRKREAGDGEAKGARKKNRPSAAAPASASTSTSTPAPTSAPAPAAAG